MLLKKPRETTTSGHRFTLSVIYDIPSIKSKLQMLDGWQVSGIYFDQTGEPLNLYDDTYGLDGNA